MIVTDKFVVLNFPKTGSSFVRKVVKDIFLKKRNKNIFTKVFHKIGLKSIGYEEVKTDHPIIENFRDHHGCYDQIPYEHKSKHIISVVRNPYRRLESIFKYRNWINSPKISQDELTKHFPTFPKLTFTQYLDLQNLQNKKEKDKFNIPENVKIGKQSIQFIRFYFKDHKKILTQLNEDYIISGSYKKDMCEIIFLRNENLNNDLYNFLSKNNFEHEEIRFILNHKKVNVTRGDFSEKIDFEKLISFIDENEWILLKILSDLGYNYKFNQDYN